jgi:hypothetical protein
MRQNMNRKRSLRWMIAAAVFGIATAAVAEEATIRYNDAKLRAKPTPFDTVATLKKGDKVQVLAHEAGWVKIQAGGKQGWIAAISLADAKGKSLLEGLGEAAAAAPGSSSASAAGAGKGAGESEQFAQSKNLSRSGLDRMIALRKTVDGSEYESFVTQGKVGPGKK